MKGRAMSEPTDPDEPTEEPDEDISPIEGIKLVNGRYVFENGQPMAAEIQLEDWEEEALNRMWQEKLQQHLRGDV
jgi:hypothetical protein